MESHGGLHIIFGACLSLTFFASPHALSAQSILLVVTESANGTPVAPPLAVREGLAAELFGEGVIVFDFPDAPPRPGAGDRLKLAAAAGADLLLEVNADYSGIAAGLSPLTIAATAAFVLTDVSSGTVRVKGTIEDSSKDRQKTVDRSTIGQELGKLLADRILQFLAGSSP